jgi:hypothetical protein
MKKYILAVTVCCAAAASACVGYENKTTVTGPTGTTVASLMGNWASASASVIPSAASCADFKWNATELTPTAAKGSFSATCAGDLKLSGTAEGTLSGSTITWTAAGNATSPSLPSCAITLNGTAELGVNSIRVPYNGTTCLGPVSGVEVLNKK